MTQVLIEDLRRTDHLVYVDTTLNISKEHEQAIKNEMPINFENVSKRSSQIAEKAHDFLQRLNVPTDSQFSDPNFRRHLKVKT